jgi:hypothetical protein
LGHPTEARNRIARHHDRSNLRNRRQVCALSLARTAGLN